MPPIFTGGIFGLDAVEHRVCPDGDVGVSRDFTYEHQLVTLPKGHVDSAILGLSHVAVSFLVAFIIDTGGLVEEGKSSFWKQWWFSLCRSSP